LQNGSLDAGITRVSNCCVVSQPDDSAALCDSAYQRHWFSHTPKAIIFSEFLACIDISHNDVAPIGHGQCVGVTAVIHISSVIPTDDPIAVFVRKTEVIKVRAVEWVLEAGIVGAHNYFHGIIDIHNRPYR
jgi:hypothetical protein